MDDKANPIPIACVRLEGVFSEEIARRHTEVWEKMKMSLLVVHELEAGYAFRFPLEDVIFKELAEFITYECRCCPFFLFSLELNSAGEEIWLRLSGGPGVKEYLKGELLDL